MKTKFYLTVDRYGQGLKTTKHPTAVSLDQVCIVMNLDVPDGYFNRPNFVADVALPEPGDCPMTSVEIENARESLREATGLNLTVSFSHTENDNKD